MRRTLLTKEELARLEAAFKPQLAATIEIAKGHGKLLQWPLLGSPKYDGIRSLHPTPTLGLVTRKLKKVPSLILRQRFENLHTLGFDGEMIYGDPVAEDCFQRSTSAVMSENNTDAHRVQYYVFDLCTPGYAGLTFEDRYYRVTEKVKGMRGIVLVPQKLLSNLDDAMAYEEQLVVQGYEGLMLRKPKAPYKWGRSTMGDQYLMKWKRFEDSEAEVLAVFEQVKNVNELTRDELGYAKRSSAKDGKVPVGRFGGFTMRDLKSGITFDCGTGRGLTLEMRDYLWSVRGCLPGQIWKYRFQPTGVKEKPRFPVLLGPRDRRDL